jgi:hypothetical protein
LSPENTSHSHPPQPNIEIYTASNHQVRTTNPPFNTTHTLSNITYTSSQRSKSAFHVSIFSTANPPLAGSDILHILQTQLDLISYNIPMNRINCRGLGKMVIHLNDGTQQKELYQAITSLDTTNLSLRVSQRPINKSRIVVLNVTKNITPDALTKALENIINPQENDPPKKPIRWYRSSQGIRGTAHFYEMDMEEGNTVIEHGSVSLSSLSFPIRAANLASCCRRCGGFDHDISRCKHPPRCIHCGGLHPVAHCKATTRRFCFRCNEHGTYAPHSANSLLCPFFRAENERLRSKLYTQ